MDSTISSRCWIGFDLGGTKMMAAALDSEFKLVGRKRRKTKGNEGSRAGMERIIQTIRDAMQEAGLEGARPTGIGIGCPGLVDIERGVIVDSANLGWKNVHIKEQLEEVFACPVVILNDVDAGVFGEYRFGAAKNARCVIGVFPGTGIGGGCVYQGQILRGKSLSCFEIGHMLVNPAGLPCGCGRNGCLETEASRLAISSAAAMAAFRGEAPNLLAAAGTDLSDIRSGVLADAIKAGDVVIERIVQRAAGLIGQAVGDLANLLAPDVVVLGGGLVEAMPDLFSKTVDDAARRRAVAPYVKGMKVVVARLGDDAVVRGAAAWAEASVGSKAP
ncbi:ROK family protein [Pirellula staleyi DSM 6068]|uniref:ROK family protein n=1 Tax=Pirellula staleyi (strain ATCC 27377 / DSM 6068 / ICPB 4128) TaxID=530564 RepID=D2QYQ3_PIRSD|nr:ROK family protein [Pirellula staleyi]ADB18212.1 ROK family protein [Pirellula staleyi DSM 6068]